MTAGRRPALRERPGDRGGLVQDSAAMSSPRTVTVDPDAVEEMACRLDGMARDLQVLHSGLVRQTASCMGAIPPSDLQNAYGYCWGRWSQVLLDTLEQLTAASTGARVAATEWRTTESEVARQARVGPPGPEAGR